jgi:adenylosuccinate synthase
LAVVSANLRIVLLSGPICSGKSALVRLLEEKHAANIIKTRELILKKAPKTKPERKALQLAGQRLDRKDGGAWVGEALQRSIDNYATGQTPKGLYVVDSVRIPGQIEAIRRAYGAEVHHIHLTATDEELRNRYEGRSREDDEAVAYDELKRNRTEREIEKLADIADIVVSTDRCNEEAVLVRATALLNLYPRSNDAVVDVLIGGQFGSEGKGNIVGHIAPEYHLLVRVGGPNAGHQVYAEPKPEKYYHLPSGTRRAPNAKLLLGPGAVIYPKKLLEEIAEHKMMLPDSPSTRAR